jgi:hypothetical protein
MLFLRIGKRTDNTVAKEKRTKGETAIYKHYTENKRSIPTKKMEVWGWGNSCLIVL